MGSEEGADGEGYEIAEEVRAAEPLSVTHEQAQKHALAAEFVQLCRNPIDGMYVIPSHSNQFQWLGVLFVRSGLFQGAILRFTIDIPHDFPENNSIPVVTFELSIFHPQIDYKTRTIDMKRYFPDGWKKEKHHIVNVLLVVQRVFFSSEVDATSCVNSEAAVLLKSDKNKYQEFVKQCVDDSRAMVYEDPRIIDRNSIHFSPWCSDVHESARSHMLGISDSAGRPGLSWLDADNHTYMTEARDTKLDSESSRAQTDRILHGIEKLDLSSVIGEESPREAQEGEQ